MSKSNLLNGHDKSVIFNMDVKSTFLNGVMKEELYVEQHPLEVFETFELKEMVVTDGS
jgi:hypothetical protein